MSLGGMIGFVLAVAVSAAGAMWAAGVLVDLVFVGAARFRCLGAA